MSTTSTSLALSDKVQTISERFRAQPSAARHSSDVEFLERLSAALDSGQVHVVEDNDLARIDSLYQHVTT